MDAFLLYISQPDKKYKQLLCIPKCKPKNKRKSYQCRKDGREVEGSEEHLIAEEKNERNEKGELELIVLAQNQKKIQEK